MCVKLLWILLCRFCSAAMFVSHACVCILLTAIPAALPPPLPRCQLGAQQLRAALPDYWPDDADEPRKPLQGLQICPGSDFKVRM